MPRYQGHPELETRSSQGDKSYSAQTRTLTRVAQEEYGVVLAKIRVREQCLILGAVELNVMRGSLLFEGVDGCGDRVMAEAAEGATQC
jgi:hypothetical protein